MSDTNSMVNKEKEERKTVHSRERVFSIVLESKNAIRNVSLGFDGMGGALIEGSLGALKSAKFQDVQILEIFGRLGVLRLDLMKEELLENLCATPIGGGDEKEN
jgi:hypothetical protein